MKRKIFSSCIATVLFMACALTSFGQDQSVSKRQLMRSYYSNVLQLDSAKADKVSQLQELYKANLNKIVADTTLNDITRRSKIQVLIDDKNRQMKSLLTPAQLEKIMPMEQKTVK